jgi:hypothetical protein
MGPTEEGGSDGYSIDAEELTPRSLFERSIANACGTLLPPVSDARDRTVAGTDSSLSMM